MHSPNFYPFLLIEFAGTKYSTPTKLFSRTIPSANTAGKPYHTSGYDGILTHNAMQDDYGGGSGGGIRDAVSDHSPALVAMLMEKMDSQNKVKNNLVLFSFSNAFNPQ